MAEHPTSSTALDAILSERAQFRAFLISRLGNEADADDVLQNALAKALRTASEVRDEQKIVAWFYQVLRNALADYTRERGARAVRDDAWAADRESQDEELEKVACRCVEALIHRLKPREAELVRRIELANEPVAEAARTVGISANNASVTLHRARKRLRESLEEFCGECSAGACLDCDCTQ
jgi:RNA polymerase sigma-70 factor (ECF subfamily)